MAQKRLAMRDIKELLRLRFKLGLSRRQTAKASGFGRTTVQEYEQRAISVGLTNPDEIEKLSSAEVYQKLGFRVTNKNQIPAIPNAQSERTLPDWNKIREEMALNKHTTLMLLWTEYKEENLDGFKYSRFCDLYSQWKNKLSVVMRQEHRAGEKAFIDYAGTTMEVIDRETGIGRKVQIFVSALGASSYIFAEGTWTQALPDWLMSHRRMLEFYGGVTQILVPDNLKSGITCPDRYEAKINESYREFAEHYGTCVIPARVRKPKDKAKVEVSVQVATRWIIMALRHKIFYSLEELNAVIRELLIKLNNRKMRHLGKSRQELFETLDKPFLKPLPEKPYEYGHWKQVRVNLDYHIEYEQAYYSVPYQLIGKELWVRASVQSIEIYENLQRVCSHRRCHIRGRYQTDSAHRPKAHQEHAKWTPERIIVWAATKGPIVGEFIQGLFENKVHKEQGYRSALGCIRLAEKFGNDRLNEACRKAIKIGSYNYQTVKNILSNGMDKQKEEQENNKSALEQFANSENTRGTNYYH